MSCSSAKAAGAVGGKAARACDSCLRRRARWYCAADDAFLCQGCDTSVHSANPLARRHERLRLRASSPPRLTASVEEAVGTRASKRQGVTPAWSKRKARTRRPQVKSVGQLLSRRLVVPEMAMESSDERKAEEDGAHEEEEGEGQLLYRVPVFDPALVEFCSPPSIDDAAAASSSCFKEHADGAVEDTKYPAAAPSPVQQLPDSFVNFEPTDAELREFAADMEALLGQGLDVSNELQDSFYMETLGLITPVEEDGRVKMEPDGVASISRDVSLPPCRPHPPKPEEESADVLDIDFNCTSPTVGDDDDGSDQKSSASNVAAADAKFFQKSLDLRLNYEEIIESWGSSPWTDGRRPHGHQLDDFWPNDHHYQGLWAAGGGGHGAEAGTTVMRPRMDGPGREARVTRYREKRRTRLFSKKIRYEVRKLNAEKRPRMKGRFVKRPAGAGAAACAVT
ncbi:zinc finger protein CONSTANS-LIKE 16-like [Oryza brachyantha]|uniref:zinc finger protein CONSTANS-LIKE 16-like n=1 Tax=Oryza brachyantha TaxID=4533 RepID=UPI001ADBEF1F|nr:zinc finger protein CONSTANS-LIKE 16-like [Oryza brachyantha]